MIETTLGTHLDRRSTTYIARSRLSEAEHAIEVDTMTQLHAELTAGIKDELENSLASMPSEPVTQTFERADDLVRARAVAAVSKPVMDLVLDVHPGDTLVGAPFDDDWHVGGGLPFGKTGSLETVSSQGESDCGAAIFITNEAAEDLYVSVNPVGTHRWSWMWADAHRLASRGGLGMLARRVGDAQPVFLRRVTLWSVFGDFIPSDGNWTFIPSPPVVFGGDSGGGAIADAKDVAVGPQDFSSTVGPATFYMSPGERFAVWFWQWQVFSGESNGFIALQTADLSAFTVSASPPVILH
ncbi:hypothetical protein A5722_16985 [Mycobacterium vulneris]|nr:hypothetical protein A5722_16985 [Mycolicibacterium vulneris]OCB65577.1 hypothetical protein A5729_15820 [Mycolicibacterium vulneris]